MTYVYRTAAPADIAGPPTIRFTAPGSATDGRYGLFEYTIAANAPGPGPHYHQTFSEAFYVVSGELTIYDGSAWTPFGAGDFVHVPEHGVHGFRNDSAAEATFLILFAPAPPREEFFRGLADIRGSGRQLSAEEWTEFYARHDQVNL